ncbi:hypothetical protein GCM10010334_79910 [Streptomyces finlayi]|uniref:Uncharacterized protein n=1 Tax=Streptomyces finlayi TaxID=67296 RepID=A0A918X9F6_9ACTN|nr:hypothetical protein GCM10010334_79910 [Streptomyces finlayi]
MPDDGLLGGSGPVAHGLGEEFGIGEFHQGASQFASKVSCLLSTLNAKTSSEVEVKSLQERGGFRESGRLSRIYHLTA